MYRDNCTLCGRCCTKHWLLKLTNNHEKEMFKEHLVYGEFIWTDECPYLKNNICEIHDNKPMNCKKYFCEGKL